MVSRADRLRRLLCKLVIATDRVHGVHPAFQWHPRQVLVRGRSPTRVGQLQVIMSKVCRSADDA